MNDRWASCARCKASRIGTSTRSRGSSPRERAYKLRDGSALDLKQLSGTNGAYQRWDAVGICDLPASGARIAARLGNPDDLPFPRSTRPLDTNEVVVAFGKLGYITVKVQKPRSRFDVGPCLVEMTRVSLDDRPDAWTVAIEGEDATPLEQLKKTLCLSDLSNQNYPEWLVKMYF